MLFSTSAAIGLVMTDSLITATESLLNWREFSINGARDRLHRLRPAIAMPATDAAHQAAQLNSS